MELRKVSNKEGEQIREDTDKKAAALLETLKGANLVDVQFRTTWINQRPVIGVILEKDGKTFLLTSESDIYWECPVNWIAIEEINSKNGSSKTLSGECGQGGE